MKTDFSYLKGSYDPKSCCVNCHREILISELQEDFGILDLINEINDPDSEGSLVTCRIEWECIGCKTFNELSVTVKGYDEMWYEDDNRVSFEGFGYSEVKRFEVVC